MGGLRFVPVGLRDGVKRNRIRTRPEDRSGSGRSGTVAGGLSRLRGAPIGTFGGAKGRVSTAVNQRLGDRGGRLWLSQTRGLVVRVPGQAGAVGMAPGVEPAVHHGIAPGAQRKAGVSGFNQGLRPFRAGPYSRCTDLQTCFFRCRAVHALALAATGRGRADGETTGWRSRRRGPAPAATGEVTGSFSLRASRGPAPGPRAPGAGRVRRVRRTSAGGW